MNQLAGVGVPYFIYTKHDHSDAVSIPDWFGYTFLGCILLFILILIYRSGEPINKEQNVSDV